MPAETSRVSPVPLARLAIGILGLLVGVSLLPTCETARKGTLHQPLELFLLQDEMSEAYSIPYEDETGAISGFVSATPDFALQRIDEYVAETKYLPVIEKGKVTGKQPHQFIYLYLRRRDRKRMAAFSEDAVGKVWLARMGGQLLSSTFVTEPSDGESFVISGPVDERTQTAVTAIQASLSGSPPPSAPELSK